MMTRYGFRTADPPSAPGSSPGQAFGISPARGEKGSVSKVSLSSNDRMLVREVTEVNWL